MDVLVDLIIYLVRKFAESRPAQVRQPTPQELAAHQAAMKQRLEAMQKGLAAQQARTQPRRKPKAVAKQAAPAKASLSQPPATWTSIPAPQASVPPVATSRKPTSPLPELRIPLILGEILAPPVGLRGMEQW